MRFKNAMELLSDAIQQLKVKRGGHLLKVPMVNIEVKLFEDGEEIMSFLGFHIFLEAVSNDLYHDGDSDWADADKAEVDTY